MAAPTKCKNQNAVKYEKSIDVSFDGLLPCDVRENLTTEFIKFILYQRQQLPMPFDQLKSSCAKCEETKVQNSKEGLAQHQKRGLHELEQRKRQKTVDSLNAIFKTLEGLFSVGPPIRRVVIILGATIVSPKETYELVFPAGFYEGRSVEFRRAKFTLFQRLVSSDLVCDAGQLPSLSKVTVLVEAERDARCAEKYGLIAKGKFKIPSRGKRYTLNLQCKGKLLSDQLSKFDESEFDISGVEAMEVSKVAAQTPRVEKGLHKTPLLTDVEDRLRQMSLNMTESTPCSGSQTAREQLRKHLLGMELAVTPQPDFTLEDSACVWYQLPVCAKGFRNKESKLLEKDMWF